MSGGLTQCYTGLNGFQGIEVAQLHLAKSGQSLPYNANAYGTVMIPNPSVNNVAFGDISMTMYVGTTEVGNATLPDLVLAPGNNTYGMLLTSNQVGLLEVLKQPQYKCGVVPVTMKGNQSVVNGQSIPYYTIPLQLATLSTTLNLTDTLNEAGLGSLINGTCESS